MLRLSKLGPGREAYYLQAVGLEPPGEWLGRGPASAGLAGEVGAAEFTAFLSGRDPHSGEILGARRNQVRVTGFDLTFAAPKSVSVLYGLADQTVSDAVAEGHRAAVSAALGYVEDRALGVRRGSGSERRVERLDGAFGAAFLHRTSRALDPHLHSHVVVANLGRGPDGRFSALDGRGVYAHAGAIGALYHVQLRDELRTRLGVEWGPLDRGRADLVGIGAEVRRGFSQRSAAIEADLATYTTRESGPIGRGGHRAVEVSSLKTRQPKDLTMGADDLRPSWRQRAIELGLGPARLESVLERGGRARRDKGDLGQDPEHVVIRLASAGRPVSRRSVVQAWCMELPLGAKVNDVERASDRLLGALSKDGPRSSIGRTNSGRPGGQRTAAAARVTRARTPGAPLRRAGDGAQTRKRAGKRSRERTRSGNRAGTRAGFRVRTRDRAGVRVALADAVPRAPSELLGFVQEPVRIAGVLSRPVNAYRGKALGVLFLVLVDEDLEDMSIGQELGEHDALGRLVSAGLVDEGLSGHAERHHDAASLFFDQLLARDAEVLESRHGAPDDLEPLAVTGTALELVDCLRPHVVAGEHRVGDAYPVHGAILPRPGSPPGWTPGDPWVRLPRRWIRR